MNTISKLIKPAHKSVARSVGYALTTSDEFGWAQFTALTSMRLSDAERAALAFAALQALHPDHEVPTIEAALGWEVA